MSAGVQHSALTKKGLRRLARTARRVVRRSALCPDEEGIKTPSGQKAPSTKRRSALCPDEEGIKTEPQRWLPPLGTCSALCPDEEGIKTTVPSCIERNSIGSALCPDEEGIKTWLPDRVPVAGRVQHSALTKKGLRQEQPHNPASRPPRFSTLP